MGKCLLNSVFKYKSVILWILFVVFSTTIFAQQQKIDSLLIVLKTIKADTNKIKTLNVLSSCYLQIKWYNKAKETSKEALSLAESLNIQNNFLGVALIHRYIGIANYFLGNYDTAIISYQASLKIYEKFRDKLGIAGMYNNIGLIHKDRGNYSAALPNFFSSLEIKEKIGDTLGIANTYNNLALVYFYQGNYPEALKMHFASLKLNLLLGNKNGIARTYNNVGSIYNAQGTYSEALKYHLKALKIYEELTDSSEIASTYGNMGNVQENLGNLPEALKHHYAALRIEKAVENKKGIATDYENIGNIYAKQGLYTEALKNLNSALEIRKGQNDKHGIADSYNNISVIYNTQGRYTDALASGQISLKIREEIGDKVGIATSLNNIGLINLRLKRFSASRENLIKSLTLSKNTGNIAGIREGHYNLAQLDSSVNDYKAAFENFKLYNIYKDSLWNEESTKKTVEVQMQFDYDKKQSAQQAEQSKINVLAEASLANQIQKTKAQKKEKIFYICGSILMLFLILVMYRLIKLKSASNLTLAEKNEIISKEIKYSDALMENILPVQIAKELKQTGNVKPVRHRSSTIMFTDFKGFTKMSEELTPEQLVKELDYCFKNFDEIIIKHNIEKIKTIGDSYMCVGGLSETDSTSPEDVIRAALEIRDFIIQYNIDANNKSKYLLEIRIGIHTGSVIAGVVGKIKYAYDIWGDAVNVASRMESSCEPGRVNISENTFQLIKDKFKCIKRGKIIAKNKGEMDMYFVESAII